MTMIYTSESARVRNAVLGCSLENDRMILVHFQVKPFSITVVQDHAPTTNSEEAEVEWFYEDLQHLLEIMPKKKSPLIMGDWNAKTRSSDLTIMSNKSVRMPLLKLIYIKAILFIKDFIFI